MDLFTVTLTIPGALTADKTLYWTAFRDCQLLHISTCCQTQDATLLIGDSSDADSILNSGTANTGAAVAAGTTPVEFDLDDFVGDQYPHISDGTVVVFKVGHGSNCVDFTAVMTFADG